MQAKLNPLGKINFPGFQEILDFTATGSEASVSVSVDGDTDKEYFILVSSLKSDQATQLRLNSDSGTNYGYQVLTNNGGSISSSRYTASAYLANVYYGEGVIRLSTPYGFLKTALTQENSYSSGTTMAFTRLWGADWNSTSNVTSLNFYCVSGNFTAGTRIVVYARRSNT